MNNSSFCQDKSLDFTIESNPIQAKSITWPYTCFGRGSQFFWLFNAFQGTVLNKVQLPQQEGYFHLDRMLITVSLDLYIVLKSNQMQKYQLWKIDLSSLKKQEKQALVFEKCMEYSYADVGNRKLLDIKIRGESRKSDSIQNLKMIVLILHEGSIYSWIKGYDEIPKLISSCTSSKIIQKSTNEFIFG